MTDSNQQPLEPLSTTPVSYEGTAPEQAQGTSQSAPEAESLPKTMNPSVFRESGAFPALFGLLILLALLAAYWPALSGGFVWDDESWTSKIVPLLSSFSGLGKIWFEPTALQQYYPLTATTFWVDYHLWGFRTTPYHVENVILHGISAWLFWRLLLRLEVPGARLAALIFALHPVMVESVAWITERKNVLSLVLYLGAILAYGRFTRYWSTPDAVSSGTGDAGQGTRSYWLALFLCLGALLAKTTAFSLPAVLLVICWWKLGRIRWRADVVPTLPFFALAIGLSLVTAYLEKYHLGAHGPDWNLTFAQRFLVAGRVLWFYAAKLCWPSTLAFVYPRWEPDVTAVWQWLYPVGALGVMAGLVIARNRIGRGPAAAVLFFAGTLFPVLGFMNAYFMLYSYVCDHWTYLSSLGLIALAAALATRMTRRAASRGGQWLFPAVLLPVLAVLTWNQSHMYRDMESLWRDALRKNPAAWMPHVNLSKHLTAQGRNAEAEAEFREAVRLRPNDLDLQYNFANLLARGGKVDEAIGHYRQALQIDPNAADVHNNLAVVLFNRHQLEEAAYQLRETLRCRPEYPKAYYRLGKVLAEQGKREEALRAYGEALRREPGSPEIRAGLRALGVEVN